MVHYKVTMLILQIDPTILVAVIGVLGGVLPVGITYVLTKNKEINASMREEKTKRYDDLLEALTLFVSNIFIESKLMNNRNLESKKSIGRMNNFVAAYNRASTYASDEVLDRCNDLVHDFFKMLDEPDQDSTFFDLQDDIRTIYQAVRLDINPKARSQVRVMFPSQNQPPKKLRTV